MMDLICELIDVPPNTDIPSSLKVLLKRKEGQSYKSVTLNRQVNKQNITLNYHSIFHVSRSSKNNVILKLDLL